MEFLNSIGQLKKLKQIKKQEVRKPTMIKKITPLHDFSWYLKWVSCFLILVATSARATGTMAHIDLWFGLFGTFGWFWVGMLWHDRALILLNAIGVFIYLSGIIQFMSNVFVVGNGESRKDYDLNKLKGKGKIYGCNGLYRDFTPDVLVAVDQGICHEIYNSGYCQDNETYLRGWTRLPSMLYESVINAGASITAKKWQWSKRTI